MINILNKEDCCGCGACVQRCPVKCITMHTDEEGFQYPKANPDKCIGCGLCDKVCPIINQSPERTPLKVYGATNNDKTVLINSSSGGVFSAIVTKVLDQGGIVFGARYDDNWEVVHDYAIDKTGIEKFKGSKYTQSSIGSTFQQAETFLKQGKLVLFSGTPCQIAGLHHFLRRKWDNLITVEVMCHGVPSPLIWKEYLTEKFKGSDIESINFRDKEYGWTKFSLAITLKKNKKIRIYRQQQDKNDYMIGFLHDFYLRPSCFSCPAKKLKSDSDITIGDFWHVQNYHPEKFNKNGVSLVCANTVIGKRYVEESDLSLFPTTYDIAVKCVPSIIKCAQKTDLSEKFWQLHEKNGIRALKMMIPSVIRPSVRIKNFIKSILGERIISLIKG